MHRSPADESPAHPDGSQHSPGKRRRRRSPLFRRRFTKPGAPPGRFAGPDVPNSSRIRLMQLIGEQWEQRDDVSVDQLPGPASAQLTWIDVRGVQDHDAVEAIGRHIGLHPLVLADIVNVGQRPKVEEYGKELFVVVRMAVPDAADSVEATATGEAPAERVAQSGSRSWRWEQFSLYVAEGIVASFQEDEGDCLGYVRRRLMHGALPLSRADEPGELLAMILDAVVDAYFPLLEDVGDRLEMLEDQVIGRPDRAVLTRIYQMKRELLAFRRSAWPLREVLGTLARGGHPMLPEHVRPFLRDTADHALQVVDVLESYRELAASFVDVYLSSVSNQTNEVMRVLTIIATIFIPLTFLAGVYGMNFQVLPELEWKWGYLAFWLACLAVTGTMLAIFRHLGWLGRRR